MTENGGLQAWATSRIAAWSDLGAILDGLERKRDHTVTDTLRAIELYRALGRDLSIVRRTLPASRMTRALAQSYARLHAVIYRKPHNWRERLRSLFQDEIPQVVRELRGQIQLVALLFALSAAAGWWLIAHVSRADRPGRQRADDRRRRSRPALDRRHPERGAVVGAVGEHPREQHRRQYLRIRGRRVLRPRHVLHHRDQRLHARRHLRVHAPARHGGRAAQVRARARRRRALGDLSRGRSGHDARRIADPPDARDAARIVPACREQDQQAAVAVRAAAGGVRLHRRLYFAGPGLPDDQPRDHRLRILDRDARRAERPAVRFRRSGFSPTSKESG